MEGLEGRRGMLTFVIPEEKTEKNRAVSHPGEGRTEEKYAYDSRSLTYGGKPILPVMGEFHYSRWEDDTWEEELYKMKAGGIQIVASYIFWIHHEEKEGEWNFAGRRNIRKFVQTCRKAGLQVFLRIGPWVHAEVRNGGLPDWVQHSGEYEVRTNAEGYLKAVRKYFKEIGKQLEGLMFRDGGPVIGIQLENEYGHVGGPEDPQQRYAHMKRLYAMAREAGFIVPYYTATGWGHEEGMIEETLPVLGGYVDAPWDTSTEEMPAVSNFLFIPYRNDATIGTDRTQGSEKSSKETGKYPFLTAELGTGLQVTSHRRPYASAADTESNVVCMLGSGANLLGYYMYHGGINPEGQYSTLNEEQRIGGYTTLPVKSYDFEAPINECGKANDSFGALRKWNLFVHDFGGEMAGMEVILPEELPCGPEDMKTLRAAVRFDRRKGRGYLFINNHQRLRSMMKHENVQIRFLWKDQIYLLPIGTVKEDAVYVYRFSLGKDGETEKTPGSVFCRLGDTTVVYKDDGIETTEWENGYLCLGREAADRTGRFSDGLYMTGRKDSIIIEKEGDKELYMSAEKEKISVLDLNGKVSVKEICVDPVSVKAGFQETTVAKDPEGRLLYREYKISLEEGYGKKNVHNLYLHVEYDGDRAEIYEDGKLLDDWYTTGADWNVNLKRFGYPAEFVLRIYDSSNTIPCTFGQTVYYDLPVRKGCDLRKISVSPEYRVRLQENDRKTGKSRKEGEI